MFSTYVDSLQQLALAGISRHPHSEYADVINAALDGGPSVELAKSDSLDDRRLAGAFFTDSGVARRMVERWRGSVQKFRYVDPACGAGDLLLAIAQELPVLDSLEATLHSWGELLVGFDLDTRFVTATKARLTLLARQRSPDGWHAPLPNDHSLFPGIVVADGLVQERIDHADKVRLVMNPPFATIQAPERCSWTKGGVSAAAVFFDHWIDCLASGSEIVALLPDALRSGARYQRLRHAVESRTTILDINLLMQFSPTIDIDVFLIALRVGDETHQKCDWWKEASGSKKLRDLFHVKVGTVVPHRDSETGPLRAYATTRDLPIGLEIDEISNLRRFSGTVFEGPFLTVRRTSRPDGSRCAATLVSSTAPIAVENHLLVLLPKDGSIATCRYGDSLFRVVDGKQRLETILMFSKDEIVLRDYGDTSVDGRKWSEIRKSRELLRRFLDYVIPVEQLTVGDDVNEVFDRLNRNNRNLNRQELRHAKFDGWFLNFVENEATHPVWQKLGVVTPGKARRMNDAQFLSELLIVVIGRQVHGFDQDEIDRYTARYQDPLNSESDVDRTTEDVEAAFHGCRSYVQELVACGDLARYTREARHMYSLWASITLSDERLPASELAASYLSFMSRVNDLSMEDQADIADDETPTPERSYYVNSRGASTELPQRRARHESLMRLLRGAQ